MLSNYLIQILTAIFVLNSGIRNNFLKVCMPNCNITWSFVHCQSSVFNVLSLEYITVVLISPSSCRISKVAHVREQGDMVIYRYCIECFNMFEDQYELAKENLEYAFVHCRVVANKKQILNYLIFVNLVRGRLPGGRI